MFDSIIGNERVKGYLTRMIETKSIGHSLLFAGPRGIGKALFAHAFAKALICSDDPHGIHRRKVENDNHPDIREYRPEGKIGMHSMASLRQLSEEVYLAPYEAKWKIFLIHEAERMLSYSANALLKTFEEPFANSIIILLSSAPASLLPTILSRCRAIYFSPLSKEEKALIPQHSSESHALRKSLLSILAQGAFASYKQLQELCAEIANQIEQTKAMIEEEEKKDLLQGMNWQDLTATQKQTLEKEIEGAISIHLTQEAHVLFDIILGWYRDMNLLLVNGNRERLMHADFVAECDQALQQGQILSIEVVQKAINEARLSLERSTSLNLCLENLFLKLNLLK